MTGEPLAVPTGGPETGNPLRVFKFWQAECLRAVVLAAGVLTVGGAVALLVMGVLASGGARPELRISGILLALVVAHCLAQIWLGILGFRAAMRWIAVRSPKDPF